MQDQQHPPIEPDSLSETLLEIAAKHGNAASVEIVASYAAHLTDSGRDALMHAIAECYSPKRFLSVWQPIETAPKDGTRILLYDPMTSGLIYAGCWDARFESNWNEEADDLEYFGKWTAYEVQSWNDEEYAALAPTHWMPLPTPPQI